MTEITCIDCDTVYFRVKSSGTPSKRCPECRVKYRKAYEKKRHAERWRKRET
jgi:uncharacterized Zn finger protein (UPF0148 family)